MAALKRAPGWAPTLILLVGCALTQGGRTQRSMALREPLQSVIPSVIEDAHGTDVQLSESEQRVAGMTDYLLRTYNPGGIAADSAAAWSVYVGYYDQQARGRTIHSPKNCLPGGGWEALASSRSTLETVQGPVTVNRYLLHRRGQHALVLYWYQGRGRVEANEYKVKFNLLRDALLHRRSEEALVRIVVPVTTSEAEAFARAQSVAVTLVPALYRALPI